MRSCGGIARQNTDHVHTIGVSHDNPCGNQSDHPLWRRDSVKGVGTSWAPLGGLISMDALTDGTHKLRLHWLGKKD